MICMAVGGKKKGLLNRLLDTMSRGGKYPKGGVYDIVMVQEMEEHMEKKSYITEAERENVGKWRTLLRSLKMWT